MGLTDLFSQKPNPGKIPPNKKKDLIIFPRQGKFKSIALYLYCNKISSWSIEVWLQTEIYQDLHILSVFDTLLSEYVTAALLEKKT